MKRRYREEIAVLAFTLLFASAGLAQLSVSGSQPVTVLDTAPAAQSIAALNGAAAISLAGQAGAAVKLTGKWPGGIAPRLSFGWGATLAAPFFFPPPFRPKTCAGVC